MQLLVTYFPDFCVLIHKPMMMYSPKVYSRADARNAHEKLHLVDGN